MASNFSLWTDDRINREVERVVARNRRMSEDMKREINLYLDQQHMDRLNSGQSVAVEIGNSLITVYVARREEKNFGVVTDLHGWDDKDCSVEYLGGGQWRFKTTYDNARGFASKLRHVANKIDGAHARGSRYHFEFLTGEGILSALRRPPVASGPAFATGGVFGSGTFGKEAPSQPALNDKPRSIDKIERDAALAHEATIKDLSAHALRPSTLYVPKLEKDGDMWIAIYGDDLVAGVVGCGPTPELALLAFDKAWHSNSGSHVID